MWVACFFDTTQSFFTVKLFNIACSTSIWVVGYVLFKWGIMSSILALGITLFAIAYISAPLSIELGSKLFLGSICFICISFLPFPNHPTEILPQIDKPVSITVDWKIYLSDENYNMIQLPCNESIPKIRDLKDPISDYTPYIKGDEETITKNALILLKKYIEANPDKKLSFIKMQCSFIPENYIDQYGCPNVYIYYKYINKDGSIIPASKN